MRLGVLTSCGLLVFALGCAPSAAPGPAAEAPPRLLSQTGLFAQGVQTIASGNLAYAPQYPLWSDGADKARWAFLPPGTRIDTSDPDAWQFPVGTKFWKQFSFNGRKVETRLLWRTPKQWVIASYAWNPEQTEATLAPEGGLPEVVAIAPGKRHSIPSVAQCRACHQQGRFEILGFSALQLSTDRDPLALHGEPLAPGMATLETLIQGDRLSPAREELLRTPPRILAASPRERAILGYLSANCGSCHKNEGPYASLGLHLKHTAAGGMEAGLATTVGQRGRYHLPGASGPAQRVQPGSPSASSMYVRMNVRGDRAQMPPLATELVDREAVDRLGRWIKEDLPPRK